jgi:hypothetical protein
MREAIAAGTFEALRQQIMAAYLPEKVRR